MSARPFMHGPIPPRPSPELVIGDPTHIPLEAPLRWSRGNLAEFLPGVLTPLTWDFWRSSETAGRRIYYRLGLAERHEMAVPEDPAEHTTSIFHGWPVANVDVLRGFVDRAPGDAGDSFERQLLGESDLPGPLIKSRPKKRRLALLLKGGWWFQTFPAELRRVTAKTRPWWQATIARAGQAKLSEAQALLGEIRERLIEISVVAGFGTLGGQLAFARLESLLPAEQSGALGALVAGGAELAEIRMLDALAEVAGGACGLDAFLSLYGFYGPGAGECSEPSWREDPSQVEALIEGLQNGPARLSPAERSARRSEAAEQAFKRIAENLPGANAAKLKRAIAAVERFTLWREDGKASALMAYDAMRATVRRIGVALTASGHLAEPGDAFYFTIAELAAAPFSEMDATALWRKARRRFNETLAVPDAFVGAPIIRTRRSQRAGEAEGPPLAPGGHLIGIGVSPGVAEGTARIIRDPRAAAHLAQGDILVCAVTDPAWAALFVRAGGLITDIGGMLSHGAVVARELGLPAIVNTRGATNAIPDGARIRMDGTSGEIEILAAPGAT